jgi:UDP-N-acetylglucosamine 3-dehydrogenase
VKPKLRAGLVGLGMMGRHHARLLSQLEGVEFVGAADQAGDTFGAVNSSLVVSTVEELIDLGIDYCIVAVPTAFHFDVGRVLAEHGIHVLMEKPLAANVAQAEELSDLFDSRGLVGCVGHVERFNPSLRELRSRLSAEFLGSVFQVATRRQGPFPDRIIDAGVVMDLATHDLDTTMWTTGDEYSSLAAYSAHRSGRSHEDLVTVCGRLSRGAVTNHIVNWLSPLKERVTVVTGERGTLVADTLSADLTYFANGVVRNDWDRIAEFRGVREGDMTRYAISKREPLLVEHESFRDQVLGLGSESVTMAEGLKVMRAATAVLRSAGTTSDRGDEHAIGASRSVSKEL